MPREIPQTFRACMDEYGGEKNDQAIIKLAQGLAKRLDAKKNRLDKLSESEKLRLLERCLLIRVVSQEESWKESEIFGRIALLSQGTPDLKRIRGLPWPRNLGIPETVSDLDLDTFLEAQINEASQDLLSQKDNLSRLKHLLALDRTYRAHVLPLKNTSAENEKRIFDNPMVVEKDNKWSTIFTALGTCQDEQGDAYCRAYAAALLTLLRLKAAGSEKAEKVERYFAEFQNMAQQKLDPEVICNRAQTIRDENFDVFAGVEIGEEDWIALDTEGLARKCQKDKKTAASVYETLESFQNSKALSDYSKLGGRNVFAMREAESTYAGNQTQIKRQKAFDQEIKYSGNYIIKEKKKVTIREKRQIPAVSKTTKKLKPGKFHDIGLKFRRFTKDKKWNTEGWGKFSSLLPAELKPGDLNSLREDWPRKKGSIKDFLHFTPICSSIYRWFHKTPYSAYELGDVRRCYYLLKELLEKESGGDLEASLCGEYNRSVQEFKEKLERVAGASLSTQQKEPDPLGNNQSKNLASGHSSGAISLTFKQKSAKDEKNRPPVDYLNFANGNSRPDTLRLPTKSQIYAVNKNKNNANNGTTDTWILPSRSQISNNQKQEGQCEGM